MQNTVTLYEAKLLRLLYFFMKKEPPERAVPLLQEANDAPTKLSSKAVSLVKQALSKGTVHQLSIRGGWKKEAFLRDNHSRLGRLWERTLPTELGLAFTNHSMEFLYSITSKAYPKDCGTWKPKDSSLAMGDKLLLFFAYEAIRGGALFTALELLTNSPWTEHGLIQLMYPEDSAGRKTPTDFSFWFTPVGSCVLEALQDDLTNRWIKLEASKGQIKDCPSMVALGTVQERVLSLFLTTAEKAKRWDLALFLLRAASKLLTVHSEPTLWTGSLKYEGLRLADRTEAVNQALVFLKTLEQLKRWQNQAASVGYFDEDYHAMQLWKENWEKYQGDVLVERAQTIVRKLDPMKSIKESK